MRVWSGTSGSWLVHSIDIRLLVLGGLQDASLAHPEALNTSHARAMGGEPRLLSDTAAGANGGFGARVEWYPHVLTS